MKIYPNDKLVYKHRPSVKLYASKTEVEQRDVEELTGLDFSAPRTIRSSTKINNLTNKSINIVTPLVAPCGSTAPGPSVNYCSKKNNLDGFTYLGFLDEAVEPPQEGWYRDYHRDGTCKRCVTFNITYNAQNDTYTIVADPDSRPTTTNRDLEQLIRDFVISINEEVLFKQTATILFRISFFAWFSNTPIRRRMQEASDTAYKIYYKIIN